MEQTASNDLSVKQLKAVLYKNALLTLRNKVHTCTPLGYSSSEKLVSLSPLWLGGSLGYAVFASLYTLVLRCALESNTREQHRFR